MKYIYTELYLCLSQTCTYAVIGVSYIKAAPMLLSWKYFYLFSL